MDQNNWVGKRVLITGVCGTIGRQLLRLVSVQNPLEIVGIDNNETELFFLDQEYRDEPNTHLYLCDVRDRESLVSRAEGIDIILHTAALKHVILCEKAPSDAIQTNILGVENIIYAAKSVDAERVIFTSSDKAVNPTNVMGTSKLMGERLMTAANAQKRNDGPIFASTRFGNVLGSRGSVIPLFTKQISAGGPVTLTDSAMTRFIMTVEEAAQLVIDSVFLARGGEVFVTKMPIIRIEELACVMIEILAPQLGFDKGEIEIVQIGSLPGEKLYEELMNQEETRRAKELRRYFVITPAFKSVYHEIEYEYPGEDPFAEVICPYNSTTGAPMSRSNLREFLLGSEAVQL